MKTKSDDSKNSDISISSSSCSSSSSSCDSFDESYKPDPSVFYLFPKTVLSKKRYSVSNKIIEKKIEISKQPEYINLEKLFKSLNNFIKEFTQTVNKIYSVYNELYDTQLKELQFEPIVLPTYEFEANNATKKLLDNIIKITNNMYDYVEKLLTFAPNYVDEPYYTVDSLYEYYKANYE